MKLASFSITGCGSSLPLSPLIHGADMSHQLRVRQLEFVLLLAAVIIMDHVHDILQHTNPAFQVMMEMYSANDWNDNLIMDSKF